MPRKAKWTPDNVPRWFWDILDRAGQDPEVLSAELASIDRDHQIQFRVAFDEACDELLTPAHLKQLKLLGLDSEDGLEDYTDAVVSQGYTYFSKVFSRPGELPTLEEWDEMPELRQVTDSVFLDRYRESLYEALQAYYDEHRPGWRS